MKTHSVRSYRRRFLIRLLAVVIPVIIVTGIAVGQTSKRSAAKESLKLGFVDSQVIIQQFPEALEAQKKIQASLQAWQEQVDTMAKAYQTRLEEYDKKKAMLNDPAKLAEEQKLLAEQQKIVEFRNKKLGQGGELSQLQEKTMTPVKDKIIKAIQAVAKEEGMSFVFDKGAEVPVLLYGDTEFDVTFKVLDRLKRGK
ncbi:MAG: OmpH family outer membrane protein [Bacteroidota bacterium]